MRSDRRQRVKLFSGHVVAVLLIAACSSSETTATSDGGAGGAASAGGNRGTGAAQSSGASGSGTGGKSNGGALGSGGLATGGTATGGRASGGTDAGRSSGGGSSNGGVSVDAGPDASDAGTGEDFTCGNTKCKATQVCVQPCVGIGPLGPPHCTDAPGACGANPKCACLGAVCGSPSMCLDSYNSGRLVNCWGCP